MPYIKTIEGLVGNEGLYPSRSELIRVAIREFLLKEIEIAKNFQKINEIKPEIIKKEDDSVVRVPKDKTIGIDTIREYKIYRIVKK